MTLRPPADLLDDIRESFEATEGGEAAAAAQPSNLSDVRQAGAAASPAQGALEPADAGVLPSQPLAHPQAHPLPGPLAAEPAEAAPLAPEPAAAPASDGLLVQFAAGVTPAEIAAALDAIGARASEVVREAGDAAGPLLAVPLDPGVETDEAVALLTLQPGVAFAEPDYVLSTAATSNDPRYLDGSLWGMLGDKTARVNAFGSQAGEAWTAGFTGSMKTVVGIVDTGMDYRHADLYQNVWLNQKEIPISFRAALVDTDRDGLITFRDLNGTANTAYVSDINRNGRIDAGDLLNDTRWENGRDEDGNGYADDLVGWDFANGDNDPFDDNGHGTHVSGTIGASGGNGAGVAGVAWNVQMMALKFLTASGSGSTSAAVKALDYFTQMAAQASPAENFVGTNNSWGGGGQSQALADAIGRAAKQDLLFIAAAGNGGGDGIGDNNDVTGNWPSNYDSRAAAGYDNVIAVASITSAGERSGFSNYGRVTVDLAAPGSSILSTLPGDAYGTYSGTSMATPHVTGAAVLYAAANPNATAAEIRAAILGSAEATNSLTGLTATGGRLDVGDLLVAAPALPAGRVVITRITDDFGSTTGTIAAGGLTDDRTPTLGGTLSLALGSGETLAVYRNGAKLGDAAVSGLNWSFAERGDLAVGSYNYTARVEKAGAAGSFSSGYSIVVDNHIWGTAGSDTVTGTSYADVIAGVPSGGSLPGRGSVDRLVGGAGADTFVFGDARGLFYDDGVATNAGKGDYGQILDFQVGDRIQLLGSMSYFGVVETLGGRAGMAIYADFNHNMRFDTVDELIGHVAGVTTLKAADIVFV